MTREQHEAMADAIDDLQNAVEILSRVWPADEPDAVANYPSFLPDVGAFAVAVQLMFVRPAEVPKRPTLNLPEIDIANSEQNAWVQDWLSAFDTRAPGRSDAPEGSDVYGAIEDIQGGYSYEDHRARMILRACEILEEREGTPSEHLDCCRDEDIIAAAQAPEGQPCADCGKLVVYRDGEWFHVARSTCFLNRQAMTLEEYDRHQEK
jgi:hypothetical protein